MNLVVRGRFSRFAARLNQSSRLRFLRRMQFGGYRKQGGLEGREKEYK